MNNKFFNTSERYGDYVEVTISDYRELNPEGEFFQTSDGIFEVVNGESVKIAESN